MRKALMACLRDESGNEVIEYTLVVGLVVVGCIGLMGQLGNKVAQRWQMLAESML